MTASTSHCAGTRIQSPWLFRVLTQRIVKEELFLRHIITIHVWACSLYVLSLGVLSHADSPAFLCRSGGADTGLIGPPISTKKAALIALKWNLQHVRTSLTQIGLAFLIDIERRPCRLRSALLPEALQCTSVAQTPIPAPGNLWPQERRVCKRRCAAGTEARHAAPQPGQAGYVYVPQPIVLF